MALNRESGITFVIATHDTRVMGYARRLIGMRDGRSSVTRCNNPHAYGGVVVLTARRLLHGLLVLLSMPAWRDLPLLEGGHVKLRWLGSELPGRQRLSGSGGRSRTMTGR